MDSNETENKFDKIAQSIAIHRSHLINIINGTHDKLKIIYCLDDLLKSNGECIAPFLSKSDLKFVMDTYIKCPKSVSQLKLLSPDSKTKIRKSLSLETKLDIYYSHMLAILHHNPNIMNLTRTIFSSKSYLNMEFLIRMEELREYIVELFYTTAEEEKSYNKQIGQAWVNNEKYKVRNIEMETMRENKLYELSFKIAEKNRIMEKYQNQIEKLKENCIQELHKIINDSERVMANYSLSSEEKQILLAEESKQVINKYQNLLDAHLAHEKILRVKRFKVETVLAGWLAKYDQDIGDLQAELEEITNGYNQQKAEFDELQANFDEQEIQYIELMEEREAEEQLILNKKRFEFIMNRSARRIQRWWRAILARRKRRHKKKGKGKKK